MVNIKKKDQQLLVTKAIIFLLSVFLCDGLSACSKVDIPPEAVPVTCQIIKPGGTNASGQIDVSIFWDKFSFGRLMEPNTNGMVVLPAMPPKYQNGQPQEYFCYISNKDGYWATRDSSLVQKGAKIQLEPGGWINVRWAGSGLPLNNFSFESYLFPEFSSGLNSTYNSPLQRTPGPFIINALPSSYSNDTIARYTKYGVLEAGKTVTLELGKTIKDYEIKCLLPQNLPNDLKLTLSLLVNPDQNSKIKPYFRLNNKSGQEEIRRRAEAGIEEFHLENWPIDANGTFRFIADETWAKVIITAKRGNRVLPLQFVEFDMDGARTKTIDLQNNESLLKLVQKAAP